MVRTNTLRQQKSLLILLLLLASSCAVSAQTIYYVNQATGNDANTGTSWSTAFRNVPRAVVAANTSSAAEVDIWIATGDYTPVDGVGSLPADHRDVSFTFYRGDGVGKALKVYGGFRGNETSIAGRDALHTTYLDGVIGAQNSYHVVVIAGLASGADSVVLDGLTIENGLAGGTGSQTFNGVAIDRNKGGGVVMENNASPKFSMRNCVIVSNNATGIDHICVTVDTGGYAYGGGVYMLNSNGIITRCSFSGNHTTGGSAGCGTSYTYTNGYGGYAYGGGLYLEASGIQVTYCSFNNNVIFAGNGITWGGSAVGGNAYGAGVYAVNCNPVFSNNAFSGSRMYPGNSSYFSSAASSYGGCICLVNANSAVTSCTFSSSYGVYGGGISAQNSVPTVSNCTFDVCRAGIDSASFNFGNGGALFYANSNGTINNTTFRNGSAGRGAGLFITGASLPVITNCTVKGNYSDINGGGIDIEGTSSPTFVNCTIDSNTAENGGGVINEGTATPYFHNCTFSGNNALTYSSYRGGGAYNNGCAPIYRGCTFANNTAATGGGMANTGCYADIDSCTFTGNIALSTGSGMAFGGAIFQQDTVLRPTRCKFYANTSHATYGGWSDEGGAIYITGGPTARLTVYNTVFAANVSSNGYGGAISVNLASTSQDTLIGNIFLQNKAQNGGGLKLGLARHYVYNNTFFKDTASTTGGAICFSGTGGNFKIANNIFNSDYSIAPNVDTGFDYATSGTYLYAGNLLSTSSVVFTNAANPVGADGIWGTFDDGLHLSPCSPGVNAGNNAYVVTDEIRDLTGTSRILSGTVDVGAYENSLVSPVSGPTSVCVGSTIILTDTSSAGVWSSSNPSIATVTTTGHVTGIAQGTVTISYTKSFGCVSGFATYTVNVQRTAAIINGSHNVCVGATTTLTDTTTGGTWTSSNPAMATVGSTGIVTGLAQGSCTITYSVTNACGSSFKTFAINVFRPVSDIGGSDSICAGTTVTLTDSANGGTWSSGTPAVGTINTLGIFSGLTQGATVISYSVTNVCGTSVATVNVLVETPAAPITGAHSFCNTGTEALTETTIDGIWSSSDITIATVDGTGLVSGVATGSCTISYEVTNHCGTTSATFAVTTESVAWPIGGTGDVCVGGSTLMFDGTPGGTWSSSAPGVGSVDGSGNVTGITQGITTISYNVTNSCGPSYTTADVTVDIAAQPIAGPDSVCVGSTLALTNAAAGGAWYSSSPGVADIDILTGLVTGVAGGVATINYQTINACGTNMTALTVSVDVLPSPLTSTGTTVCEGQTISISESVPGGTWNSDNTPVATVSGGTVTGVTAGAATISYTLVNACGNNTVTLGLTVLSKAVCDSIAGTPVVTAPGSIHLFPNPSTDMVQIVASTPVNVQLLTMEGKMVRQWKEVNTISLEGLPNGMYLVYILDKNGLRIKEEKLTKAGQ